MWKPTLPSIIFVAQTILFLVTLTLGSPSVTPNSNSDSNDYSPFTLLSRDALENFENLAHLSTQQNTIQSTLQNLALTNALNLLLSGQSTPTEIFETLSRFAISYFTSRPHVRPPKEAFLTTPEIIKFHGFPVEEHHVKTADGYILTLFRIPAAPAKQNFLDTNVKNQTPQQQKPPILIQHGLLASSSCWLLLSKKSLPLLLAARGHEIWLPNFRGSTYSLKHEKWTPDNVKFWDFSFDEMGTQDIPAIFNHILKTSGAQRLNYVCHSMGCNALFIAINQMGSQLGDKVNKIVAMAPAVYLGHLKAPLFKRIATLPAAAISSIGKAFTQGRFLPASVQDLFATIGPYFCLGRVTGQMCQYIISVFVGDNPDQASIKTSSVVGGHVPSEGSMKTLAHFAQYLQRGKFEAYDYGQVGNLKRYNSTEPTTYKLSNVRAPSFVYYGLNDWLTPAQDVRRTIKELGNVQHAMAVNDSKWTHFDFLYAKSVKPLVYDSTIQFLED